jgi:hypothetical protein
VLLLQLLLLKVLVSLLVLLLLHLLCLLLLLHTGLCLLCALTSALSGHWLQLAQKCPATTAACLDVADSRADCCADWVGGGVTLRSGSSARWAARSMGLMEVPACMLQCVCTCSMAERTRRHGRCTHLSSMGALLL